jgi:SpoVK/Ycf46/Vps4 family AAA+-type ATPase
MNPELEKIAFLLRSEINELISPIQNVLTTKPEWKDSANAREYIAMSCFIFAIQISHDDSLITRDENILIRQVAQLIVEDDKGDKNNITNVFQNSTLADFTKMIEDRVKNRPELYVGVKVPDPIILTAYYDSVNGTNFSEKAKQLFWRLANTIVKADGIVSPSEESLLIEIKDKIFSYKHPLNQTDSLESSKNSEHVVEIQNKKDKSLDELMYELNELVGLDSVKKDVKELINFIKVQKFRQEKGMKNVRITRHLVFTGNPGTGKTTLARLISQIYKSLDIVSKGSFVEADRSTLVGGYLGQTAIKVQSVVKEALGGVLFIDEAYSLTAGDDSYGKEAIDTLLKLMEDNRDDLIVIVAGYTDPMEKFLSSNPGLKSRFNKYLFFEDYNPGQLAHIFELYCASNGFKLSDDARNKVQTILQGYHSKRDETFGNARLARNIFEKAVNYQANRIVSIPVITDEVLVRLEAVDIPRQ